MVPSQTHFQHAHHFEVNDSQFINIANSTIITNLTNDLGWTTLAQHVAAGAMFDSAERYPPGKCHPGTRQTITQQITEWITDPETLQYTLWLYGPAGAGKSALAQSICEFLAQSHSDRYGASFFFSKGSTDRGNALKLIATLSYQLAVRFPGVRSEINKALIRDPILLNKSMEIQMLSLIIEPILQCKEFPSHRPVIVIDGLDECADDERASTQRNIISLIAKSVLDYNLPLRFMVCSRPEYWIRDAFDIPPLPERTLPFSLRQTFEADEDIRTYLTDGFEKIHMENKRVMGSVGLPWPSTDVIKRLVYEASGQFIYASTVLKFVGGSRFSNPKEQLRIITSPGPHRASAFSELDRLYTAILSAYPRWETMKRVLGGLLNYRYAAIAKVFLDVDADELVLVLDALSSLLDITRPDLSKEELELASAYEVDPDSLVTDRDKIVFCHLSFREFLEDEGRSGAFHIDASGYRDEIARAFFGVIHRNIDEGYQTEPHHLLSIDRNTYSFVMENVTYPSMTSMWCSGINTMLPLITRISEKLVLPDEFYTGKSINSLAHFMQDLTLLERHPKTLGRFLPLWTSRGYVEDEGTQPAWDRFTDAVFLAKKRAMYALTLLPEFGITPLCVSLLDFDYWNFTFPMSIDNSINNDSQTSLSQIYEVQSEFMDSNRSIKQNPHILTLSYSVILSRWSLRLADWECLFAIWDTVNPRFKNEWKEQQNFIARVLLKSFLSPGPPSDLSYGILATTFSKLQSICSKDDLQDNSQVSALLEFVGDLSNWICPSKLRSHRYTLYLIVSVICWLDRQLTSLQALKISQDHNEGLLRRLTETINYLFKKFFLRNFLESYDNKFRTRSQYLVLKLQPAALPQGFRIDEESDAFWRSSYGEQWPYKETHWQLFHNQIFREMDGTTKRSTPSFISPSSWHPYLASRLLNTLVEFLYGVAHPFNGIGFDSDPNLLFNFKNSFSYITECLLFASTTVENLDTLRLIVYLYPKVTCKSAISEVLPGDIWLSISGFLKKYDCSLLSSEELELFELWLDSPDHGDIKKYVKC